MYASCDQCIQYASMPAWDAFPPIAAKAGQQQIYLKPFPVVRTIARSHQGASMDAYTCISLVASLMSIFVDALGQWLKIPVFSTTPKTRDCTCTGGISLRRPGTSGARHPIRSVKVASVLSERCRLVMFGGETFASCAASALCPPPSGGVASDDSSTGPGTLGSQVAQEGSVTISSNTPSAATSRILPPTQPKWSPAMRTYLWGGRGISG